MALIQLDHTPETVHVCLPLYIILPDPGQMGDVPLRQRKVLYLLHGLSENGSVWQRNTNIEVLAREHGLVVVMPSFGRSFYADLPNGQRYFTYLVEELPQYLKDVFGLDPQREDTFIAGSSMGGYGAFKAALTYPEKYACAASFSGFLSLDMLQMIPDDDPRKAEFNTVFGALEKLPGSAFDPIVWLKKAAENSERLPMLFVACGKQDDLYPLNQIFYAAAQRLGITVDFYVEDGAHDWHFWNKHIRRFLDIVLEEDPTMMPGK
jgi:putative tributyrin esterase